MFCLFFFFRADETIFEIEIHNALELIFYFENIDIETFLKKKNTSPSFLNILSL